ncbi:MAG: cytochrome subunit of sulfide dehydrogenase [Hyphomicrobiales bacterium]|nr:cytochrome subunit of sulfide dehydrogenase [Hyphomicrobiales bacterium]
MPMMRLTAAVAIVLASPGAALAADAPAGAASCRGCHAANPRVETPVPPLNGRPAADIASEMIAFKAGQRPGTIMDRIAKGFSDDEIRAIAAWYETQK